MSRKREDSATLPNTPALREPLQEPAAIRPRAAIDDDRPTELFERKAPASRELALSREQTITGRTIREIMNNPKHRLSDALSKLLERARRDLPGAEIDDRS